MKTKQLFLMFAILIATFITASAQMMPPIPVDKDVRIGKLDNGLTYYIRYNNWPEDRAEFFIAQRVGAIQEEDSQRGLAHFLEHMCFNGTEHFPGNGVIRYCESIGVKFGRDLNAYTSIDETVYNISNVPTANQAQLDSCLLILHDWSNALILDGKEIDKAEKLLEELNVTQPTLSHHMKILCDSGVVVGRKEGKWMHYSISGEGAKVANELLQELTSTDCEC